MTPEKEFDETQLRMIRAACKHTEGTVHSSVVLQLFDEIDALRAKLADPTMEPVATLFGSLPVYDTPPTKPEGSVCARCGGLVFDPVCQPAEVPLLTEAEIMSAGIFVGWVVQYMDKSDTEFARVIEQMVHSRAGLK